MLMRPTVIVNCAMSPDGKISTKERRQVRISSKEDMERVKALRASCDAILVGVGTILADDPHLTIKGLPRERQPLRIVLDGRGRTPVGALVLNDAAPTMIVTREDCETTWEGAEVVRLGDVRIDLTRLLEHLEKRGVRSLLVEGGGETIWSFFQSGLVDEYKVYVGNAVFGGREAPTPVDGEGFGPANAIPLRLLSTEGLGEGVLLSYEVVRDV